jgi:hypothetical protein
MKRLALVACLALGACAGGPAPEQRIVTQRVEVPVAVQCKPDIGQDPVYPDSDAALHAAPNIFERAKLVMAARLMRIQRDLEKSAALRACEGS